MCPGSFHQTLTPLKLAMVLRMPLSLFNSEQESLWSLLKGGNHAEKICVLPKIHKYPVIGPFDFDNEPGVWFPWLSLGSEKYPAKGSGILIIALGIVHKRVTFWFGTPKLLLQGTTKNSDLEFRLMDRQLCRVRSQSSGKKYVRKKNTFLCVETCPSANLLTSF